MKKLICLLLTMLLLLTVGLTAHAVQVESVGTGDGSITITNATVGKTYRLYHLFDATYNADGGVAYTYTKTGATDPLFSLLTDTGNPSPFTLTQVRDTNTYIVETTATAAQISAWIKSNLVLTDGVYTDGTALRAIRSAQAADSVLTFSDLAFGYYFVTSTLGTTITIDSNTPDQNVIDKNQGPSWDIDEQGSGKVITSDSNKTYNPPTQTNTVNVGDTVSFQIGVNTTNFNADKAIYEYFIHDTLGKGFVIDKTSVVVTIGQGAGAVTLTPSATPAVGRNYAITWDDTNNAMHITVPWYDATGETFATAQANDVLTVTYSATLVANDNTVYAGSGNKNTAVYDFRAEGDTPPGDGEPYHEVEERVTTTYTFALGFQKIDGRTKRPLPGAQFQLQNAGGAYLTATKNSAGVYTYTGTEADDDDGTVFETDANGRILVKGVAAGTYTVIETKAPDGYNQLASPVTVTASVDSVSTYTTTYTTYYDADGVITETEQQDGTTVVRTYEVNAVDLIVENFAGTTLPETGGIGTTLFYLLGGLLVGGAIVLLLAGRRMKYEKD